MVQNDWNIPAWYLTFASGQSVYNNSTSCITLFIINDTDLENEESFILMFIAANRINYDAARSEVNITINEDPNDGM